MRGKILIINPNSNPDVTDGLSKAVQPLRLECGPELECVTLAEGPWGIESQQDVDNVIPHLRDLVTSRHDADAFVIACYSDPGITVCRAATHKPVFGIQESGLFSALQKGKRAGVIALSPSSVERHIPYIRQLGLETRVAAERPLNLSVEQGERDSAYPRILEIAKELVEKDSADTLILGCAGMVRHRQKLEKELGLAVTDPTLAAAGQALAAVLLR